MEALDLLKRQEEIDNLVHEAFEKIMEATTKKTKVVIGNLEFEVDLLDTNYTDFRNLIHHRYLYTNEKLPDPVVKELKGEKRNVNKELFNVFVDIALKHCMLSIDFVSGGENTPYLMTNQSLTYSRLLETIENYDANFGKADKVRIRLPYDKCIDITAIYKEI